MDLYENEKCCSSTDGFIVATGRVPQAWATRVQSENRIMTHSTYPFGRTEALAASFGGREVGISIGMAFVCGMWFPLPKNDTWYVNTDGSRWCWWS